MIGAIVRFVVSVLSLLVLLAVISGGLGLCYVVVAKSFSFVVNLF